MHLDSWEISVEIETSRFCLDINVQTKKSRSRSRSKNVGVSQQFVSILIEKCVDFCIFLSIFLNPSRLFIIFRLKRLWQCWDFLTNLDNLDTFWQISTISTRLNNLDKNLNASKSWLKILNFKNLDQEKKKLILTWWTFSTVFKS